MNDLTLSMEDHLRASRQIHGTAIISPTIKTNFTIEKQILDLIKEECHFNGTIEEDAYQHLRNFASMRTLFKYNQIEDEHIYLTLFSWTLKGEAKDWFNQLAERKIATWDQMVEKFLKRFFPPSKMIRLQNEINQFKQEPQETLYDVWTRYEKLIKSCPQHGLNDVQRFMETGTLPSNTLENPRGNLEIQAITTRSGKTTQDPVIPSQENKHEPPNEASTTKSNDETPLKTDLSFKIDKPLEPVPYPQQLRKAKQQIRIENFANIFNNINVNIPLIDLLKENPHYGKYLKTLLSNKGKDAENSSRFIITECKAIFQKFDIPKNLGDAGSITVPCSFNDSRVYQALADTGASINLMPYSLYKRLGLGELTPTRMSICLADSSFNYPMGIAENIPVKIDKFTFPTEFVVLEMKENDKIPIVLGRPFLRTAAFEFQMQTKTYSLGIGDDIITLNNNL
ncbi:uncharacterized protein [Rutidosis leptorrhynchoides]|uniref:uncharacterized protein n=1 Tax=Rutidosis leptorrhynchoides TaxID=125765 RepID=UPI003A99182F